MKVLFLILFLGARTAYSQVDTSSLGLQVDSLELEIIQHRVDRDSTWNALKERMAAFEEARLNGTQTEFMRNELLVEEDALRVLLKEYLEAIENKEEE